jgi:hypothetical protein
MTFQSKEKQVIVSPQLDVDSRDGLMISAGVLQAQCVAIDVFRSRNLLTDIHGMITTSVQEVTRETQE